MERMVSGGYMSNKIFVYGTLTKGFYNHRVIEGATLLGTHETEPEYTMANLGGFPAVLLDGEHSIKGEVYEVDEDTFRRADALEGYPSFYNRIEIDTKYGKAWMYYIKEISPHRRIVIIEAGEWK